MKKYRYKNFFIVRRTYLSENKYVFECKSTYDGFTSLLVNCDIDEFNFSVETFGIEYTFDNLLGLNKVEISKNVVLL